MTVAKDNKQENNYSREKRIRFKLDLLIQHFIKSKSKCRHKSRQENKNKL